MEPRRHAGGHKHAALWQRLSLLALLVGTAQGLTIKPGTANSFTNETITFTADVPVRWNVVPRQGRPNFQVVMQNLQQIRIRAGNIEGKVLVVAQVVTCSTPACKSQLNSNNCELVWLGVQRVAQMQSQCGLAYANADWGIEPWWKAGFSIMLLLSIVMLFIMAAARRSLMRAAMGSDGSEIQLPDVDFSRIVVDVREGTSKFFGSSFGGGLSPKAGAGGGGYTELGTGGGGGGGSAVPTDALGEREEGVAGGQGSAAGGSSVVKGLKSMGYGV